MSIEIEEKWEPVPGIDFAFVSIELHVDYPQVAARLVDGRVDRTQQEDLIILFSGVLACTMHEEFVHPARVGEATPLVRGTRYPFPCLRVCGSPWFESLRPELQVRGGAAVHHRLRSQYPVVDVVSADPPRAHWYRRRAAKQDAQSPHWASRQHSSHS